jgi:hypothetical protein
MNLDEVTTMMTPTHTDMHGSFPLSNGNVQWPLRRFTPHALGEQHVPAPPSQPNETEQLLDLDGLLKIVRLIQEIKKDGRLKSEGGKNTEREAAPIKGRTKG